MNEQLQNKLVEILAGIQAATKAAGDFALEHLPDIAQSYVVYGRFMTLFECAAALITVITGLYVAYRVYKHCVSKDDLMDMNPAIVMPGIVVAVGFTIFGSIALTASVKAAALVWFAPKVWLLKELASMVK